MAVTIRTLGLDEYRLAAEFIDRVWAKNHIYVRDEALFQWTFHRPEIWDREGFSFAIAEESGEIRGALGAIPFVFNDRGSSAKGVWLANWIVTPEARQGTGVMLLDAFRRPPFEHTVSFGINKTVARLYKTLGWQLLESMPRHVLFTWQGRGNTTDLLRKVHPEWDQGRLGSLVEGFLYQKEPEARPESKEILPDDWNERGWKPLAERFIGASRDLAYLKWRYVNHPRFAYRVIVVEEEGRPGLMIWRLETIRQREGSELREVAKFGRVVEFLPVSETNGCRLVESLVCRLDEEGAIGADYYGLHSGIGRWLERAGFRNIETHPDGAAIPSRFQPLDGADGRIMSAVTRLSGSSVDPKSHAEFWYWTKSDSDQDRPN